VASALRVGHAFHDFSDHSLRLRFRSMSWRSENDLGPLAGERSRIAGNSRDSWQTRKRRGAAWEGDQTLRIESKGIERHAVSTITVPAVNSIAVDNRRLFQSMAAFFVAFAFHLSTGMRAASETIECRFAEFARVPYQNPLSRQQWEDLWEAEP
jgi:hypothetical protein